MRLLLALAFVACTEKQAPPAAADAGDPDVPEVVVRKETRDLLFSYRDDLGTWHDVDAIEKVPESFRSRVLVRDLARSPEELRTAELLYVADLSAADADGRYPCAVVSRYAFERGKTGDIDGAAIPAARPPPAEHSVSPVFRVTMYMTSWCPVCKKAAAFLRARGVTFAEKDIEKDEAASRELFEKARKAGLADKVQGVPVIDVGGYLLLGFDPRRLEAALERLRKQ